MSLLQCAQHGYTLQATCPTCGQATAQAGPAKYSPEDRYGVYRRRLKLMERAKGASERSERADASTAATPGGGREERSP